MVSAGGVSSMVWSFRFAAVRFRPSRGSKCRDRVSSLGAADGQGFQAAQHDAVAESRLLAAQADLGETLQQHLKNDPAFQACKRSPDAVVDAAPERQVRTVSAADIEPVGIVEHVRVPVGRAEQDDDVVALSAR